MATNMDDFRKEDGKIDWDAYTKAEINSGERCFECNGYIGLFSSSGTPRKCYNCNQKEEKEEWESDDRIRCPKCRYVWNVDDGESYDLYTLDCHEVTCPECNYDFSITTRVSYDFTSPELLEKEIKEAKE